MRVWMEYNIKVDHKEVAYLCIDVTQFTDDMEQCRFLVHAVMNVGFCRMREMS
jgi:hypothetical protein